MKLRTMTEKRNEPRGCPTTRIDGGEVEIETADPTHTLYDLTSWAVQRGVTLESLEVTRPSLEDVYLAITGGVPGSQE